MKTALFILLLTFTAQAEFVTNVLSAGIHSLETNGFDLVQIYVKNTDEQPANVRLVDAPSTNTSYVTHRKWIRIPPPGNAIPAADRTVNYPFQRGVIPPNEARLLTPEIQTMKHGLLITNDQTIRVIYEKQ